MAVSVGRPSLLRRRPCPIPFSPLPLLASSPSCLSLPHRHGSVPCLCPSPSPAPAPPPPRQTEEMDGFGRHVNSRIRKNIECKVLLRKSLLSDGDMLISLLRTFTMAKVYFRDMHSLLFVTISFYFDVVFFILYHCFYCSDVNWKVVRLNSYTTSVKSCITDFV